ncbi:MAG: D-alanine--D-alanine ligase [Polyangiaceae bacterium]|nr:D-alanine--D-alanine ligase [Polyangiaceae bacterium]
MTPDKLPVLVLYGGKSSEHEISILSARFVVGALDRTRFEPVPVGIARSGRWHLQTEAALLGGPADARSVRIDESGPEVWLGPGGLRLAGGGERPLGIAFPVLHGPYGEDGTVQGLFEVAGLAYVGAGVLGSAVSMDKDVQKRLFEHAELPVVPWRAFRAHDWHHARERCLEQCEDELGLPAFVKPARLGSSVGVRRATDHDGLVAAIEHACAFDTKVIVERALGRPREIEVAILGNEDPMASSPGEIGVKHADGFYSYAAKYLDPDGAELCIPARLYATEATSVQLLALRAFRALGMEGMARVDMFLDADRNVWLNEVNAIPGMTSISMFPRLWEISGYPPQALVSRLVELGLERHRARAALRIDEG